jgi:hypothetical protein
MGEIQMTMTVEALPTTNDLASLIEKHPRGRGFGILSRLARVEDVAGRHVREDSAHDEPTTVVTFERRDPDARHRRDDATTGLLHFG